jgi:hypothetical protein
MKCLQDLLEADQVQVLVTGSLHLVGGVLACIMVCFLLFDVLFPLSAQPLVGSVSRIG